MTSQYNNPLSNKTKKRKNFLYDARCKKIAEYLRLRFRSGPKDVSLFVIARLIDYYLWRKHSVVYQYKTIRNRSRKFPTARGRHGKVVFQKGLVFDFLGVQKTAFINSIKWSKDKEIIKGLYLDALFIKQLESYLYSVSGLNNQCLHTNNNKLKTDSPLSINGGFKYDFNFNLKNTKRLLDHFHWKFNYDTKRIERIEVLPHREAYGHREGRLLGNSTMLESRLRNGESLCQIKLNDKRKLTKDKRHKALFKMFFNKVNC